MIYKTITCKQYLELKVQHKLRKDIGKEQKHALDLLSIADSRTFRFLATDKRA